MCVMSLPVVSHEDFLVLDLDIMQIYKNLGRFIYYLI